MLSTRSSRQSSSLIGYNIQQPRRRVAVDLIFRSTSRRSSSGRASLRRPPDQGGSRRSRCASFAVVDRRSARCSSRRHPRGSRPCGVEAAHDTFHPEHLERLAALGEAADLGLLDGVEGAAPPDPADQQVRRRRGPARCTFARGPDAVSRRAKSRPSRSWYEHLVRGSGCWRAKLAPAPHTSRDHRDLEPARGRRASSSSMASSGVSSGSPPPRRRSAMRTCRRSHGDAAPLARRSRWSSIPAA